MDKVYDVIVAGAGAAGMMAAVSAAKMGAKTAVLEHMDQAGKKLLSTGNGKCNFTNQMQGVEFYRGKDPAFVLPAFQQFGLKETLDFFKRIGIWPKEKRGGYYYPASEQAASVRDALLLELKRLGVDIFYNIGIRSIHKDHELFVYETKQGRFESRHCILATGGKAAKKTGSDGSGIPYIRGFGHTITEFSPALVQLQGAQSFLKETAGIRADAVLKLHIEEQEVTQDRGEVQLTDFGVSGIPAFQVSRYAVLALKEQKKVHVTIDFTPDMTEESLLDYLWYQKRSREQLLLKDILPGLLNQKLIPIFLKEAALKKEISLSQCGQKEFQRLTAVIKALRIDIIGSKSFDFAQVCSGGVDTDEIHPETMESKLVKGLYFAGEVVDIDGMCGGYNLQWAWTSGWTAGHYGGML